MRLACLFNHLYRNGDFEIGPTTVFSYSMHISINYSTFLTRLYKTDSSRRLAEKAISEIPLHNDSRQSSRCRTKDQVRICCLNVLYGGPNDIHTLDGFEDFFKKKIRAIYPLIFYLDSNNSFPFSKAHGKQRGSLLAATFCHSSYKSTPNS
jgi:hypothetical protein